MLFLVLNIILLSGFGLFLKHAKNNQQRLNPIGFVNYLSAFFISIWVLSQEQDFEFSKLTFALGISNGVTYALGFELFTIGIQLSGIVVTAALVRLSIVLPILVAMIFWQEIPNLWQTIGLLLTFVAIPLLSQREKEPRYTFTPDKPEVPQGLGFAIAITISVGHRYLTAHHESLQRNVSYRREIALHESAFRCRDSYLFRDMPLSENMAELVGSLLRRADWCL